MKTTRRSLLRNAAAAAGGAALAVPLLVRASALGAGGPAAPGNRIVMGVIGTGGRGTYDMTALLAEKDVRIVAVCDVQKSRREAAKRQVDGRYGNADCAVYRDFRELIARGGLDAVLVATGDRWHTPVAVHVMRAGLDLYCEKPCTMSVAEGKVLVDTARRYARVFQAGMQRLSEANFVFADECARSGRLGKVHTMYAHILPFRMYQHQLPSQPTPDPAVIDWDRWLGPAPWRPFNPGYLGNCGTWLDYYDFGTGVAGWGSHTLCQCQAGMSAWDTSAAEYEYNGSADAEGFTLRYANGMKVVLTCKGWRGTCGVRYEGSDGWVSIADNYPRPDVSRPALLEEYNKIVREYTDRSQRPMSHIRDFIDCVRSRRSPIANEVVAHRTMSTNHAVNASMLLKRSLRWDAAKEEFIGDADANRFLARTNRAPWGV